MQSIFYTYWWELRVSVYQILYLWCIIITVIIIININQLLQHKMDQLTKIKFKLFNLISCFLNGVMIKGIWMASWRAKLTEGFIKHLILNLHLKYIPPKGLNLSKKGAYCVWGFMIHARLFITITSCLTPCTWCLTQCKWCTGLVIQPKMWSLMNNLIK